MLWWLLLLREQRLQGAQASVAAARGFSSCGSWALEHKLNSCGICAQLLLGIWDLPGPGIEPGSPALVGRILSHWSREAWTLLTYMTTTLARPLSLCLTRLVPIWRIFALTDPACNARLPDPGFLLGIQISARVASPQIDLDPRALVHGVSPLCCHSRSITSLFQSLFYITHIIIKTFIHLSVHYLPSLTRI